MASLQGLHLVREEPPCNLTLAGGPRVGASGSSLGCRFYAPGDGLADTEGARSVMIKFCFIGQVLCRYL